MYEKYISSVGYGKYSVYDTITLFVYHCNEFLVLFNRRNDLSLCRKEAAIQGFIMVVEID
ncbi:hypothetical protein KTH_10560 [Thermosporothrix hazakensis]|nr:hypothetical protein KTH_10560 [Thermosporothrix hazakensis]